jgi:fructokinase
MTYSIGLDIGGTKIAGAIFDEEGRDLSRLSLPTPDSYGPFLETCRAIVEQLEQVGKASIGVCAPYADENVCANVPYLAGKDLRGDLEKFFERRVGLGNDANCAALAEATEGAGKGYRSVFALIMGTGVGGGFVVDGQVFAGANGLCGEIGHLPLPCYEADDGEQVACGCGKKGCVETFVSGAGLARLYRSATGKSADAKEVAALAIAGDAEARAVLDRFYTLAAKAMVVVLHSFDPDVITVSGGLSLLPGLYDEVPKRWGNYAICKKPATKFLPASCGPMAGVRGAALLGRLAARD